MTPGGASDSSSGPAAHVVHAAALLAVAAPALLAFNVPPSATFLNQAAAIAGWGVWCAVIAGAQPGRPEGPGRGARAVVAALVVLLLAAGLSMAAGALPPSLAWSAIGMLLAVIVVVLVAAVHMQDVERARWAYVPFVALAVAGVISAFIGALQVFAPDLTGSSWIAATAIEGRAVGNLRQPNHLATLLLWSIVAAVWLGSAGKWPREVSLAAATLMLFGLVLTASRTGMVGAAMLVVWGVVDRSLSKPSRVFLWVVPVLYVAFWMVADTLGASGGGSAFHGDTQLHRSDISSSRFAIWSNTLSLIAAHPWLGVGWGEFNFAWSLTPFPDRPTAFFDHTHNLPLQLAVELGLPIATLVLALLGYALWCAFKAARDADAPHGHLRPAFVMVLMIAVHSELEYPLWYAYFLLPTAYLWGLCLAVPRAASAASDAAPAGGRRLRPLVVGSLLLILGGVCSVVDYWKVVVIFAPSDNAAPLSQRILDGRRSLFFGHHADYAAATSVPEPGNVMPAFATATHYLLDTRLMMAWAKAHAANGDLDRARHIAARLREFRNPASDEFFAVCDAPTTPSAPRPIQCEPPSRALDYRDFR